MNSHTLARILLAHPDMPVTTHANNHTAPVEAKVNVGVMTSWRGESLVIGNFSRMHINYPNEYVTQMVHGKVSKE